MCKLLLMTGIQDGPLALEFMKLMARPMSVSNRDGIGYTAVKPNGDIFSQRWHKNEQFFDQTSIMTPEIAAQLAPFKSRLPNGALELNYSQYGEIDFTGISTLTMHTRFATCERTFANVHPFIDRDEKGRDISLVHNGCITNADWLKVNKISTCDSEAALQTYIAEGVLDDTSKAKKWLDILSGSWAFGILGRNPDGKRILDVVRGSSSLYYLEAGPLGKIFATSDTDALGVLKEMGIEVTLAPEFVKFNSMHRFDAITGELLEVVDVKPVYDYYNYNGSRFNQNGEAGTRSATSPAKKPSNISRMSKKDKEYTAAIMAQAMGDVNFPDVFNEQGGWDTGKVKKYCDDSREPLIDRLDLFDDVHGTTYCEDYESFPEELQDYIEETDFLEGNKSARQTIKELVKTKGMTLLG